MADLIKLLPDGVVNQIAAGEVIQRPSSVVKELLDNAIDSGATEIKLLVKEAGKLLILVQDNGCGMSPADARMAFERHATSKIRTSNDLFGIRTMGFRGEAMASMAAVAEVELKTKRAEDAVGTRILISDSKVRIQEPCACIDGTQVSVQHLFYSVPARKKFLKSDSVELRHIHDEFVSLVLAHPEISWSYNNGNNEVYNLSSGGLKQRIAGIFGKKYLEELISLEQDTEVVGIRGFIGSPVLARKSRGEQFLYINRRPIKNHYLNHAISSAYEELLAYGNYPFYVLFLEMDSQKIDINVHPTKQEIKFEDERLIYNFLKVSVKYALGKSVLTPGLDFDNASPGLDQMIGGGNSLMRRTFESAPPSSKANWKDLAFPAADRDTVQKREETIFNGQDPTIGQGIFASSSGLDNHCIQIYDSYILLPNANGLLFIDQQAAHERILYESYLKNMKDQTFEKHRLLFPQTMHLNKSDAELMQQMMPQLNAVGFDIEDFGTGSFIVHAMPAMLEGKFNEITIIKATLEEYKSNLEFDLSPSENAARSLAKSCAIRKGRPMGQEEMSLLVEQLFLCDAPQISPFGKRTSFQIKMSDFKKNFYAL
ncbi:MAG: DNA mismatch repair endonuclease MutL [Saprospiraceae bacterium]|nr:DNA mismatch repair endonuclease MutL [Saprospiraceae bacterium]